MRTSSEDATTSLEDATMSSEDITVSLADVLRRFDESLVDDWTSTEELTCP